ncbi:hypothetical protein [Nevskia soli]|nr:hypothetical protein [Nevskia soli]
MTWRYIKASLGIAIRLCLLIADANATRFSVGGRKSGAKKSATVFIM